MEQFWQVFRMHNEKRARENFTHDISPIWWTNAIAGEVGEACNIAKKISRGDYADDPRGMDTARRNLAIELADVITYCDLLMSHLGFDTELMLLKKFDIVSERVNYPFRFLA